MLLTRTCPVCRRLGRAPCAECAARLVPPPRLAPPDGLDRCVALFAYDEVGAELVAALKFANHRDAVGALAAALATLVGEGHDVVTWVPASVARRRRNGFDHGQVLARAVAASIRTPCRRLLRRTDSTIAGQTGQTGRGRVERLAGPRLVARAPNAVEGTSVLIVDDVRTTGASLRSAAAALRANGAREIVGATLAATPERSRVRSSTIRSISEPPKGDRLCRSE